MTLIPCYVILGTIHVSSTVLCATLATGVLVVAGCGGGSGSGSVSIDTPDDGATVESPVHVEMSAEGLDIESAGTVREGAGHFHLLIDASCAEPGAVTPTDTTRLRLEDGSDQVDVPLDVGDHTLCVQAADGSHAALAFTDEVTVHVTSAAGEETQPTETTTAVAEGERWKGTSRGEGKPGRDCARLTNTGEIALVVDSENRVTGQGSTTASAYTCRSPQGTARIPEMTAQYTITGSKEPTFFLLTFSNGLSNMKIPYADGRGHASYDYSVGDYIARGVVTLRCVGC